MYDMKNLPYGNPLPWGKLCVRAEKTKGAYQWLIIDNRGNEICKVVKQATADFIIGMANMRLEMIPELLPQKIFAPIVEDLALIENSEAAAPAATD
jgi:hypothetical protein